MRSFRVKGITRTEHNTWLLCESTTAVQDVGNFDTPETKQQNKRPVPDDEYKFSLLYVPV